MKRSNFLKKAANSFAGRVLRRLLGEEKGAVMMEYVVVGLLIAAAAVVIVGAFGGAMNNVFAALSESILGRPDAASATVLSARTDFTSDKGHSDEHAADIRNNGSEAQNTVAWQ